MRKLAFFALAAGAALVPAAASAQMVVHQGPGVTTTTGAFQGGMFPHSLQPGFVVPPMWFGPQFTVGNWQTYGFPAPARDQRWVRYYDDAYLVDRDGRIQDARRGLDWDRYGERWDTSGGIPHYYGSGDFHPGAEDYAWVERNHGGYQQAQVGPYPVPGYGPPGAQPAGMMPAPGCHSGSQPCGGGYYGGYGYGYGVVAYPIVIETTVVGGGCGCSCECGYEEVVEETVEYSRPVHRPRRVVHRRPAPPRRAPPPPGERG